ncbi:MAG: radical SAM family heme chaperone HemW, partial [Eubacteriales bacterium]|nr:radical SAM family heme chaperone HemW [Eubacteriales bacterium]
MKNLGLYIHIPFCRRKCHYCNFVSFPGMDGVFDRYIDAVISEARQYQNCLSKRSVDTVLIGGGTPSLLSPGQLQRLWRGLNDTYDMAPQEVTIEANPETLDDDKIAAYSKIGINRLSIGLQTHDNDILNCIGRRHTYETFLGAYEAAAKYFSNINADLMFALPGQTVESFISTLRHIIRLSPAHVSAYALKLEPGTKMAADFNGADEDTDRDMYHNAVSMLESAGYTHYETSNFAKQGRECMHNLKYWTGAEYLGLGVASHSYMLNGVKVRYSNTED